MKKQANLKLFLTFILVVVFMFSQIIGMGVYAMGRDKTPPTTPASLKVTFITENSITLTWTASTDASNAVTYYIYMNGSLFDTSTVNTYIAKNLIPDTDYSIYVKAKDPTGNTSGPSETKTVHTPAVTPQDDPAYRAVGYYTSWSAYSGFTPDKIAASKLTHINYAFANIGSDLKIALGDATTDLKNFDKLRALKKFYPHIKTLISVGGWSWSGKFSDVAATYDSREAFADSCVQFIVDNGFDGVDLDWEYPVSGGLATNATRPEDGTNYVLLLKLLHEKLSARGYLLTIAGGATQEFAGNNDLAALAANVDFVNVMTYDFHGGWDKYTDFNAPLSPDTANSPQLIWSVKDGIQLWLDQVNDWKKIVVGIPFYGKKYGAVKSTNPGFPAGLYQTYGRCSDIKYNEIYNNYLSKPGYNGYELTLHSVTNAPWLFNGSIFISFDNEDSIGLKAGFIKEKGLGGAMVWELSQDYNNKLISALYGALNS